MLEIVRAAVPEGDLIAADPTDLVASSVDVEDVPAPVMVKNAEILNLAAGGIIAVPKK
jgi:hypothetical protein